MTKVYRLLHLPTSRYVEIDGNSFGLEGLWEKKLEGFTPKRIEFKSKKEFTEFIKDKFSPSAKESRTFHGNIGMDLELWRDLDHWDSIKLYFDISEFEIVEVEE